MSSPSGETILTAYRHLFKRSLRAVQYSKPARFVVRDRMRKAFRDSPVDAFDAQRVAKTLEFLSGAAKTKGLEHKIVKNLMHVWWEREKLVRMFVRPDVRPYRRKAFEQFDRTIEALNESMGLCIK